MLKGKELLLEIINDALFTEQAGSDAQQLAFNNTELNAFLAMFKNPPEDIIYLTNEMLGNITGYLEPEDERKKFTATIKYIRGLSVLNKSKEPKISLSESQLLKLTELEELINKVIKRNEYLLTNIKERSEKQIKDYRKILVVVQNENLFTAEDYDIVEEIVRTEVPSDAETKLDQIFTFLNEFNSRKLKDIAEGKNDTNQEEIALEDTMNVTSLDSVLVLDEQTDIFESVVRTATPKTNTKLEEAERTQKIKEIIAYLGYNYDELEISLKLKLIAIKDLDFLNTLAKTLKEGNEETPEILSSLKSRNIYGLIYLLTNTSQEIIKEVTDVLKEFNIGIPSPEFTKIINTGTIIFSEIGLNNFKENIKIFRAYNVSIRKLIRDNISLLTTNSENFKRVTHKLEKKGANISSIFDRCASLLGPRNTLNPVNLIENNLSILEMYGFDIEAFLTEENPCYTVLYSTDLATKLDHFIEVGLNEYIHNSPSRAGTAFKSLVIKRIYYAFKNNDEVWSRSKMEHRQLSSKIIGSETSVEVYPAELVEAAIPKSFRTENEEYNNAIDNSELIMSDTEIENIKSNHPVMVLIDEGYRAAIYTDAPKGLLKRKTELVFGTQIISRPKVFKVFKVLTEMDVEEKEALLYAITHNSILEPHEFEYIKEAVDKIGEGKDYDRILKTI